jgi:hypothetical protein
MNSMGVVAAAIRSSWAAGRCALLVANTAHELGFSPEAEFRDRTQMQFVALLVRQGASRLILKGGMAMRALYGSTRLTKDVTLTAKTVFPSSPCRHT